MPLDAICLRAVLHELRPQLIGARIDKVQQPARDQIVLLLRGNLRLLLNAGANQPRIQLTNILRRAVPAFLSRSRPWKTRRSRRCSACCCAST